jgi:hypothetical protein
VRYRDIYQVQKSAFYLYSKKASTVFNLNYLVFTGAAHWRYKLITMGLRSEFIIRLYNRNDVVRCNARRNLFSNTVKQNRH